MRFNDAIFGAVFIAFSIAEILYTRNFPQLHGQNFGPSDFPVLIGVGLFVCGVLLVIKGVRSNVSGNIVGGTLVSIGDWISNNAAAFNIVVVLMSILGFILFLDTLGFILTSLAILFILFWRFGNEPKVAGIGSVAVTGGIKLLFGVALLVPLPIGIFGI